MSTTIQNIADWCTSTMLKRSDLGSEAVVLALGVYQVICNKVPFEALQQKSSELPLVAGTDSYDLTSGPTALSPALAGIMSIRYTAGPGRTWRLRRSHTRVYDSVTFSTGTDPRTYARFGKSVEFMPAPSSSASTFRVRYWNEPDTSNGATTTLVTPVAWDELFKWETLYRLYHLIGQEDKAAQLIIPMPIPRQPGPKKTLMFEVGIIPRLWNDLLTTISQKENVDEDFSLNPVVRPYTSR